MEAFVKEKKIVFAMVGLPARGKTYISNKIVCYLKWLGYNTKFFNIGGYRRENYGTKECTAEFFDPNNTQAVQARTQCAILALQDLTDFLQDGGDIAVYDGTNTTVERRVMVREFLSNKLGPHTLVWIESICNDDKIIENNIRATKLSSPDYREVDQETAISDFKKRIEQYRKVYEELSSESDGENVSFIKLYNVNTKIVINQINGYIESKLLSYLMSLHLTPRPVYFLRHVQSLDNCENRIGGDSGLSEHGYECLSKVKAFFEKELEQGQLNQSSKILTSTMKRTILTAKAIEIGAKPISLKALDELDAGVCDGELYDEVCQKFPEEWRLRANDKLKYRYPRGESYLDLIHRVEPIIFAIEKSKDPVIVVGHQAVIRCLYGYFTQVPVTQVPYQDVPLASVIKIIPGAYYNSEQRHLLDDAEDAIRPKTSL